MDNERMTTEELAELKEYTEDGLTPEEAERLISEVERLQSVISDDALLSDALAAIDTERHRAEKAEVELEELRADWAEACAAESDSTCVFCRMTNERVLAEKDAEIERLKEWNERQQETIKRYQEETPGFSFLMLDNQQAEIARLQAEAAAYKAGLTQFCIDCGGPLEDTDMECRSDETTCPIRKDLIGTAGKALLERLNMLEALFAKAQVIELKGGGGFIGILADDALAALDGKEG